LREGIARGRPCASVLVIPKRKSSLFEAFNGGDDHGRFQGPLMTAWQGRRRGREGRGRGAGGHDMGRARAAERAARSCLVRSCCSFGLLRSVRERRQEREEKKEKREKEKGKKKKKKKNCKHGSF
jgi:hypothetical protein